MIYLLQLEGFKNRQQSAESGTVLISPNIDESADISPDNDANQPRSLPPSLQSSELKNRDHSKRDDAVAPRATSGMENAMSSSDPTGDRCSSGRVNHAKNNPVGFCNVATCLLGALTCKLTNEPVCDVGHRARVRSILRAWAPSPEEDESGLVVYLLIADSRGY